VTADIEKTALRELRSRLARFGQRSERGYRQGKGTNPAWPFHIMLPDMAPPAVMRIEGLLILELVNLAPAEVDQVVVALHQLLHLLHRFRIHRLPLP
jgi:hypothetical protein